MRDFDNELRIAPDVASLMRATSSRLGSLQVRNTRLRTIQGSVFCDAVRCLAGLLVWCGCGGSAGNVRSYFAAVVGIAS